MAKIYFDVTDVVHFATRYNRLTGIQRVQLNIVKLLARKHGDAVIRCAFFDAARGAMFEFSPSAAGHEVEFDAESLLIRIGLAQGGSRLPSKVRIKSYLRRYNNDKLLRTWKKLDVYLSAWLAPGRLRKLGLMPELGGAARTAASVESIAQLPADCSYVCMGSMWLHREVGAFMREHRARDGDVVQMVHDLIPVSDPQYYTAEESADFKGWLTDCLRYVSRFISVSNNTAAELRKFAGPGMRSDLRVIKLAHEFVGYDRTATLAQPPELADLDAARFVICVGTIEARKNAVALLDVWRRLAAELGAQTPKLVFAGKFGKGSADFQRRLAQHPELTELVRVVHAPSDLELAWLYRNSLFTVLPSLIEGWGLPVGEGAWFGKFCVASRTTSIPEVCGELMDYVDPRDIESIHAGIRKPIVDRDYLAARERAIQAARMRTWSDVADDIFEFVTARPAREVKTHIGR